MRNDNHPQQGWAADKLLDRGWGRPMLPTVQTTTGQTFEEWLDTLSGPGKEMLDRDLALRLAATATTRPVRTARLRICGPDGSA